MNSETQLFGGNIVDVLSPKVEDVDIYQIAHALAYQCRFNGNTRKFYSVAQHSLLVSCFLPNELALHGLLHDAHEAIIGDISTPMKKSIDEVVGIRNSVNTIADKWDIVIFDKFGLSIPTEEEHKLIKEADLRALETEVSYLMGSCKFWTSSKMNYFRCLKPKKACKEFLKMFFLLYKGEC